MHKFYFRFLFCTNFVGIGTELLNEVQHEMREDKEKAVRDAVSRKLILCLKSYKFSFITSFVSPRQQQYNHNPMICGGSSMTCSVIWNNLLITQVIPGTNCPVKFGTTFCH